MEEKKQDWCTGFPEYWYVWTSLFRWKKVYIGDCCKDHDETCKSRAFLKCLENKRIVGRYAITLVASLACLIRYGKV